MAWIGHSREACRDVKEPLRYAAGREPRQETRIPLLRSMVGSTAADAKGRGSRWGVITKGSGAGRGLGRKPQAEPDRPADYLISRRLTAPTALHDNFRVTDHPEVKLGGLTK